MLSSPPILLTQDPPACCVWCGHTQRGFLFGVVLRICPTLLVHSHLQKVRGLHGTYCGYILTQNHCLIICYSH